MELSFFPNLLALAHPDWACCSEARRSPRTIPDARRGRTLLVGRSGAGSSWPATLRVVCGWLAVGVRQERNEGVGIRLVHPKKYLACCLARRAKTGSLSYTCPSSSIGLVSGRPPDHARTGRLSSEVCRVPKLSFSDPARPHPPPPGAGSSRHRWSPAPVSLSRLTNLVPPYRALYTVRPPMTGH